MRREEELGCTGEEGKKVRGGLDQNTLYECMELSDIFILYGKTETMALEGSKRGIVSILKWLKSFDSKIP